MSTRKEAFVPCAAHEGQRKGFDFHCHYCLVSTVGRLCDLLDIRKEHNEEIKARIRELERDVPKALK